ncbi:uncharacterized protein LOC141913437 isoform X2 [Tubulanus polymorphus]|uniref:uncharacterized protein LOC141913437 isoform X2 n=1 Tax=Tubulanus polymorphus TaxID=672921 RepID=UPI003DA55FBE
MIGMETQLAILIVPIIILSFSHVSAIQNKASNVSIEIVNGSKVEYGQEIELTCRLHGRPLQKPFLLRHRPLGKTKFRPAAENCVPYTNTFPSMKKRICDWTDAIFTISFVANENTEGTWRCQLWNDNADAFLRVDPRSTAYPVIYQKLSSKVSVSEDQNVNSAGKINPTVMQAVLISLAFLTATMTIALVVTCVVYVGRRRRENARWKGMQTLERNRSLASNNDRIRVYSCDSGDNDIGKRTSTYVTAAQTYVRWENPPKADFGIRQWRVHTCQ